PLGRAGLDRPGAGALLLELRRQLEQAVAHGFLDLAALVGEPPERLLPVARQADELRLLVLELGDDQVLGLRRRRQDGQDPLEALGQRVRPARGAGLGRGQLRETPGELADLARDLGLPGHAVLEVLLAQGPRLRLPRARQVAALLLEAGDAVAELR